MLFHITKLNSMIQKSETYFRKKCVTDLSNEWYSL